MGAWDFFSLKDAHKSKVTKYDGVDIASAVSQLIGCTASLVSSVTLSWRGYWCPESAKALRDLGFTRGELAVLSHKATVWTYNMFKTWSRTGALPR